MVPYPMLPNITSEGTPTVSALKEHLVFVSFIATGCISKQLRH